MPAYYNEIDREKAAWLRENIRQDLVAPGDVDERSIWDVHPDDLRPYTQCHFFAGIGIWSYALRLAGWPDDRPVWTGSCPCQPFSAAGKGRAFADDRHLWPAWDWLIGERGPGVVFGEQVESGRGRLWFDVVQAGLEKRRFAVGAVAYPAAGVGAPHGRHRIYFVADADRQRFSRRAQSHLREIEPGQPTSRRADALRRRTAGAVALAERERGCGGAPRGGHAGDVGLAGEAGPVNGFWRDAIWLPCIDGKARSAEPGTFPLAHGAPAAVLRWRGYGDGIVAPQAAGFVKAYMTVLVQDHCREKP